MEGSPAIEVRALRKEYRSLLGMRRHVAVHAMDFTVPPGEVTALLGPNGGGKTTTIKCILGLLRPTAGAVRLFGIAPSQPRARARLGYLPEDSPFPGFLTIKDGLRFFAEVAGVPRAERASRCEELLERVGLGEARGRRIRECSKGMLRRFGLAQALVGGPDLLVLDEPTSGLDPFGVRDFRGILAEERAKGRAILVSSHLLADVERVADRVVLVDRGRVLAASPLADLLAEDPATPSLEEAFFRRVEAARAAAAGA